MPRCSARYSLRALAMVADQDGVARPITLVKQNGRYVIGASPSGVDTPTNENANPEDESDTLDRSRRFQLLATSGRFTATEVRTLYLLAVKSLTVAQVAAIERCSRQAIVARLVGNSKQQGGLLKKATRFWRELADSPHRLPADVPDRQSVHADTDR